MSAAVRERITQLYAQLAALPSLDPAPRTDALFTDLVRACEYRPGDDAELVLRDPAIAALAPALRRLCAAGESRLEAHWARRILAAPDAAAELERFPYLANYRELVALEVHTLLGLGLDAAGAGPVAFLGGGPLPLSALLLAERFGLPVQVADLDPDAAGLGRSVARQLGAGLVTVDRADARSFGPVAAAGVVVLAALVGLSREDKREVLAAVARRMRPGALLVVRSAHRLRSLLYPPLDLADLAAVRPLAVLHPLNAVVNSLVVAVRD